MTKADLIGGVVPSSQLPQVAIVSAQAVPDRAAMLTLDVQQGDVAVVVEDDDGLTRTYILAGVDADPTDFDAWLPLPSPGDVNSVNGHVGAVALNAADVGAFAKPGPGSARRVPTVTSAGAQEDLVTGQTSASGGSLVLRTTGGQVVVSDAVNPNEAVTKGQLNGKVSATTTPWVLHGTNGSGVEVEQAMGNTPSGSSVVRRDVGGRAQVTDGVSPQDIATVGQLGKPSVFGMNQSTGTSYVMIKTVGTDTWTGLGISQGTGILGIAQRTSTGTLRATEATDTSDLTTLSQLNARLSAAQRTAINALPASGATVDQVVAALKAT